MGDPFPSLAWIMKPVKNERFQMVRHIQSMYKFKENPTIILCVPLNGFCEFIATLINPLEASSISILILDEFSLKVMPLCPGVNEEHAEDGGPEL